jgi:hypothetical protein
MCSFSPAELHAGVQEQQLLLQHQCMPHYHSMSNPAAGLDAQVACMPARRL